MKLISTEEAEKAAIARYKAGSFPTTYLKQGYREATEAANAKYESDVMPVLKKCKEALTNARSVLILCSLIDKSGQAKEEVENVESTIE